MQSEQLCSLVSDMPAALPAHAICKQVSGCMKQMNITEGGEVNLQQYQTVHNLQQVVAMHSFAKSCRHNLEMGSIQCVVSLAQY